MREIREGHCNDSYSQGKKSKKDRKGRDTESFTIITPDSKKHANWFKEH